MSGSGPRRWRRVVTIVAALAISAGLLAAVISRVDSEHAWARLAHARVELIGLSLLAAFGLLLCRSVRFAALIPGVPLGVMMSCTALQNLLLRVTPFRLGELGLPYLLARRTGQPAMRSLVALILVRVVELLAFALLGLFAVLIVFGGHGADRLIVALPATLLLGLLVATFATWVRLGYRVFAAVVARTPLRRVAAAGRLVQQLAQIVEQDARLDGRQRWVLGLTTLTITCLQIVMHGALLRAFGIELSVARTAVGVTMAIGFGSLPLPTVGNVGTHETGWTLGFQAMGVSLQDAVVTGVASGLITLGFAVVFAIPAGLLHIARSPSR